MAVKFHVPFEALSAFILIGGLTVVSQWGYGYWSSYINDGKVRKAF
jgi:hypothetical protein